MGTVVLLSMVTVCLLGSIFGCVLAIRAMRAYPLTAGYFLGAMILFGLISLGVGAYMLGESYGGLATVIVLSLINLVVQPLCLLVCMGSAYKLIMGLAGRVTYAFRTCPPAKFNPEEYRSLRLYCIQTGAIGLAFSVGLAYACLRALL